MTREEVLGIFADQLLETAKENVGEDPEALRQEVEDIIRDILLEYES